ncbi:hypothetical protein [Vibrio sp. Hal054]|uniref:hypothetical protein n=1 Tax=Vibrio sp. Hal054 TaxID=3035158 RepID=UPI00301D69D6
MTDWFVIMPKPDSQEVVVFNPITVAPIPLSMNKYVDGIGTVQQINFKTGETCFERYCVQGKATN